MYRACPNSSLPLEKNGSSMTGPTGNVASIVYTRETGGTWRKRNGIASSAAVINTSTAATSVGRRTREASSRTAMPASTTSARVTTTPKREGARIKVNGGMTR